MSHLSWQGGSDLCSRDGVFPFALFAEGLVTRTAQWTATINVRERMRGTEMLSKVLPVEPRKESRTIEKLIADDWHAIREALEI